MTVQLATAEAAALSHLLGGLIRERAVHGLATPPVMLALCRRLDHAIEVSRRRQSNTLRHIEFGVSHIDTRGAASILGWGARRTQRHAADLGGQLVGGRLVYDERAVRDYALAINVRNAE